MTALLGLGRGLTELLAPSRCAACELPLPSDVLGFCAGCRPLIERAHPSFAPPTLAAAAFIYGGPLATAIAALKYGRRTEHAELLGSMLASLVSDYRGRVDVVVPMPLHPVKLRARGFNQAALIAAPVARALALPMDVRVLRRARATRDQASLSRVERTRNPADAFVAQAQDPSRRVLLIDDVRTTGATMAAAAASLLEAGHPLVMTLALARTEL